MAFFIFCAQVHHGEIYRSDMERQQRFIIVMFAEANAVFGKVFLMPWLKKARMLLFSLMERL